MHFHLYHSPYQEDLADLLVEKLRSEGAGSPFHRSSVLVRNQGMGTWLRQRIAKEAGVAMLVDFPQPNRFLQHVLGLKSLEQDDLIWPIFHTLPVLIDRPEFQIIDEYLSSPRSRAEGMLKRYQLADQLAKLFDKYLLYRPQWIHAWSHNKPVGISNRHEAWQRMLWFHLMNSAGGSHWSQMLLDTDELEPSKDLPPALHVFGISNFAPSYVRFLHLLSKQIPVHVYWMNPVSIDEGYWEDAPDKRQWTMACASEDLATILDGNPLLASFGRMGREFVHTLYGGETGNFEVANFQVPGTRDLPPPSLLSAIQRSVHHRQNLDSNMPIDDSVSIHACHTPQRELETLKNYLLDLSTKQPLDTSEVLVLCPDLATYAPAIEAVFGYLPHEETLRLPFRVGDQSSPITEPSIAAILQLFQLHTGRFTNSEALHLISIPPISARLGLTESDLSQVKSWISESGIRWGFDSEHVHQIADACDVSPWTWREGLDRLLLGYAMPDPDDAPVIWNGITTFHDIEGNNTRLLGALCEFVEWCRKIRNDLKQDRSLPEWVDLTRDWLRVGFSQDADCQPLYQPLLNTLDKITDQKGITSELLPPEVFAEHLKNNLSGITTVRGFLNGKITFCEMKPMRAIPARVICLLGMNHDSFPRSSSDVQFDLTKFDRLVGDRSSRDDDCYFFLEALLSAREKLFISYIGSSIKDGQSRPPSTVLQTLIDATPGLANSVVKEKLHPFSPHYFTPGAAMSFDHSLLKAACALVNTSALQPPIVTVQVEERELPRQISVRDLVAGLTHSAKFYLNNSLQARTRFDSEILNENERVEIDGLSTYQMKRVVLNARELSEDRKSAWKNKGVIPAGLLGEQEIRRSFSDLDEILDNLPEVCHLPIHLEIAGHCIMGDLPIDTTGNVIVIDASSSEKPKVLLTTWIYQLLACAASEKPVSGNLYYVKGGLKQVTLNAPENAALLLQDLVACFLDNLQQPIPHFPISMYRYCATKRTEKDSDEDYLRKQNSHAIMGWEGDDYGGAGDSADKAIALFFTGEDILSSGYFTILNRIWSPLFEHRITL